MRYFLTLAYHGNAFMGWQKQPDSISVQETLEKSIETLLQQPTAITGCGRTDTGVHARYYVAHFDAEQPLPERFLIGLNAVLPPSIAVFSVHLMHTDAHARYDAYERSYRYYISLHKDPFRTETAWFYPQHKKLDINRMQALAELLPNYKAFYPFCKSYSGVTHYNCAMKSAEWRLNPSEYTLEFEITANRFLRGMVRLIVGTSIQVGIGQIPLEAVVEALETQKPLEKRLSVPPEGLFLTDVKYPYNLD